MISSHAASRREIRISKERIFIALPLVFTSAVMTRGDCFLAAQFQPNPYRL
jgi:hypothetical protein